jgi:uncharacterized protein (DUF433 family)
MGVVQHLNKDPLAGGFYTIGEAAKLLGIDSQRRISAWLNGHDNSAAGPILKGQYAQDGAVRELGFLDLMEVRFVEFFRKQGISLQSLRTAFVNARHELQMDHPFATSDVKFMTDRKAVFLHTAREERDDFLLNLMTKQIEFYEAVEQALAKNLCFDSRTGIAYRWKPFPAECPDVILDPRIAYGHPVVAPKNVPTSAIYSLWKAEKANVRAVASWFEVSRDMVEQAVSYEMRLAP